MTTGKTRAEMQPAALMRDKAKRARAELEIALQERAEQIAELRALRLPKEARTNSKGAISHNCDAQGLNAGRPIRKKGERLLCTASIGDTQLWKSGD